MIIVLRHTQIAMSDYKIDLFGQKVVQEKSVQEVPCAMENEVSSLSFLLADSNGTHGIIKMLTHVAGRYRGIRGPWAPEDISISPRIHISKGNELLCEFYCERDLPLSSSVYPFRHIPH